MEGFLGLNWNLLEWQVLGPVAGRMLLGVPRSLGLILGRKEVPLRRLLTRSSCTSRQLSSVPFSMALRHMVCLAKGMPTWLSACTHVAHTSAMPCMQDGSHE